MPQHVLEGQPQGGLLGVLRSEVQETSRGTGSPSGCFMWETESRSPSWPVLPQRDSISGLVSLGRNPIPRRAVGGRKAASSSQPHPGPIVQLLL